MKWSRGSSLNGSTSYEPLDRYETPDEICTARYLRKRGEQHPPSYNFAASKYPFALVSGWVASVAQTGKSTLLRHNAARVWVEWADRILPAGVHYGAHVHVIGNFVTFNVGGGFQLVNACLLDESPAAMIAAALERYPDAVVPPRGKTIRRKAPKRVEPLAQPEAENVSEPNLQTAAENESEPRRETERKNGASRLQ
jgi:hypothetical protein